jgi:hypothetical protein
MSSVISPICLTERKRFLPDHWDKAEPAERIQKRGDEKGSSISALKKTFPDTIKMPRIKNKTELLLQSFSDCSSTSTLAISSKPAPRLPTRPLPVFKSSYLHTKTGSGSRTSSFERTGINWMLQESTPHCDTGKHDVEVRPETKSKSILVIYRPKSKLPKRKISFGTNETRYFEVIHGERVNVTRHYNRSTAPVELSQATDKFQKI